MTRLLVCGGRHYTDYERVCAVIPHVCTPSVIIHGAAPGADSLAQRWAEENNVPVEVYAADWEKDGKRAGPIRNARMLLVGKPEWCIAFPGGRGTADMIRRCRGIGLPTYIVQENQT